MEIAIISLYMVVMSILGLYGFHRGHLLYLYWRHKSDAPKPPKHFDELPYVTVQLPMYNEMYVAERLLEGVASIDYPKHRLEIQVLDDSTDETTEIARKKTEELRQRGFTVTFRHRDNRKGFKAGALEQGLTDAKG